jgi:hypothetical protein
VCVRSYFDWRRPLRALALLIALGLVGFCGYVAWMLLSIRVDTLARLRKNQLHTYHIVCAQISRYVIETGSMPPDWETSYQLAIRAPLTGLQ